jgi:UDP-glucose 4-epimerase
MSSYERQPRPSGAEAINRKGIDAAAQPMILLTGAGGYVGGRLLRRLERSKRRVRCLTRMPAVPQQQGGEQTEVVEGDVLDGAPVDSALPARRGASWQSAAAR